jgi:hypothetical protein
MPLTKSHIIEFINTMPDITETEADVGKFKTEEVNIINLSWTRAS